MAWHFTSGWFVCCHYFIILKHICDKKWYVCRKSHLPPLIPKYNASGFFNKGQSIISKYLWYTLYWKSWKVSVVLIPESWTFGRNTKRTFASGVFRNQFGRLPSVRNTGWPEVLPSPSKVVASEYKITDNRWFKDGRVFSVSNHQSSSYNSLNIFVLLILSFFRLPLWTKLLATSGHCTSTWITRKTGW